MRTIQLLLKQCRSVQALLLADFVFHVGFYMLVPYVAGHLGSLGHGAAVVGLLLGLRALCQQGLGLAGGWLADSIGIRPVIVLGCMVRAVSFFVLGAATAVSWIGLALMLSGIASALFGPALNACLAQSLSKGDRAEVYAAATAVNEIGTFGGPLLGTMLLGFGFTVVSMVSGGMFAATAVALWWALPTPSATAADTWKGAAGLSLALKNYRLWLFSVAVAPYFVLFQQMYLLLPLELGRSAHGNRWTGAMFATSSVVVVLGQVWLTRVLTGWPRGVAMGCGLALMAAAFSPLALSHATPVWLMTTALLLTLGTMMTFPFVRDLIADLAQGQSLGAHFGLFYTVAGLVATGGNAAVGYLLEHPLLWGAPRSSAVFLLVLGGGSAAAILFVTNHPRFGRISPSV